MTAPQEVVIETGDGERITVPLDTNPTVGQLKEEIGKRQNKDTSPYALRAGSQIISDDVHLAETEFIKGDVPLSFVESLPRRYATFRAPDGRFAKTRFSKGTTLKKAVSEISKVFKFTRPDTFVVLFNGEELAPETILADLKLTEESVLRIEDNPKELRIVYQSTDGKRKTASTRYRGIATIKTVRERLAEAFNLDLEKTGLFLGETALEDGAVLADLEIPAEGYLELRSLADESIAGFTSFTPGPSPNTTIDVGSLSPVRKVAFRTPKKKVAAHFKPAATVGKAKEKLAAQLAVEPQQLWVSRIATAADDQYLRETDIQSNDELIVHVYRPLTIKVPGKGSVRARFAETATVKSTKEKLSSSLGIPIGSIAFADLEYSDEDAKLENLEIPESGVVSLKDATAVEVKVDEDADVEVLGDQPGEPTPEEDAPEVENPDVENEDEKDAPPPVDDAPVPEEDAAEEPVSGDVPPPESTPAEPAPAEPTPAEPTPEEPTPAEPTPAEPTPEEPAPAEPTPEEPTPAEPTPEEPAEATPAEPAPAESTPVESTPAEPTPAEPTPQEETPVPAAPLDIVIEDEEEEEAGEPPAGPEDEQADQEDDIHVSSGADVVPGPEENPPPPVIEEPVAEDGSEPLNSIPAGEPPKSPITKDDVQTVKLVLPDGQTVKIAHRAKATVGKARSAAAAEIGTTVDKVVLSYGDSELDDATLIGELQISSSGRIVASVVD